MDAARHGGRAIGLQTCSRGHSDRATGGRGPRGRRSARQPPSRGSAAGRPVMEIAPGIPAAAWPGIDTGRSARGRHGDRAGGGLAGVGGEPGPVGEGQVVRHRAGVVEFTPSYRPRPRAPASGRKPRSNACISTAEAAVVCPSDDVVGPPELTGPAAAAGGVDAGSAGPKVQVPPVAVEQPARAATAASVSRSRPIVVRMASAPG